MLHEALLISRRRLALSLAVAVVAVAVLSVRLGHPELHVDEVTYMSSAVESMAQGSVLPVKGDGSLFINKPPLALWLIRVSFELFGPSPFAARLPSILAAAAAAVVLYLFGAAVFGEAVGLLAALIFLLTPGILRVHGIRSATPDGLEILLVTSAIVLLELWRRRRRPWMLPALVAVMAASAWVKSPFALVVFLAYLLATELPARRAGNATPRFGAAVVWVAGAWFAAYLLWLAVLSAAISPQGVARRLLVEQYARRIEGRLVRSHIKGTGFYLASTVEDFGPLLLVPLGAAAAAGLAARRGWRPTGHDIACVLVWSLVAPVLATASVSKVPWYAYLSYPGITLLIALSAQGLAHAASSRRSIQAALLAGVVLVVLVRLPADRVWPAEPRYRGAVSRLWEIARRDRIAVIPGPRFQPPHIGSRAAREDWLFLRMLLTQQSPGPLGACRATLVNFRRDATMPGEVLELYRPTRKGGAGLYVVAEGCGGTLREQLLR